MKNYSNDPQEMIDARIIELEKNICLLQENVSTVSDHLRETQRYLIKLAHTNLRWLKGYLHGHSLL